MMRVGDQLLVASPDVEELCSLCRTHATPRRVWHPVEEAWPRSEAPASSPHVVPDGFEPEGNSREFILLPLNAWLTQIRSSIKEEF